MDCEGLSSVVLVVSSTEMPVVEVIASDFTTAVPVEDILSLYTGSRLFTTDAGSTGDPWIFPDCQIISFFPIWLLCSIRNSLRASVAYGKRASNCYP
jgi:hypothetical protein